MKHVLVICSQLIFNFCHRAERLVNIIELVANLSDSKVNLLLVKVRIYLSDLIQVV